MADKEVWVIGHKNPDTDSICAAIGYAELKNKLGEGLFIPKKAGEMNMETAYVLNRFGVKIPETVRDVRTQVKDITFRHTRGVSNHFSLKKAWETMKAEDVVTLPIVEPNGRLEGLIVNGDLAYSYMDVYDNSELARARTQYKNIIETLNGRLHCGNEHGYFIKGKVVVASGDREAMQSEIDIDDLVIVGDYPVQQMLVLEKNPSCMIVTGVRDESDIDMYTLEKAQSQDTVVISTEYDSFTTARLINQSMPIKHFMTTEGMITFRMYDYIDEVRDTMSKVRHRDFPVVDDNGSYIGMVSRRNLLDMASKRLILVDHNEKSQAVDGIEEAEILEIIDHHRIGTLETMAPVIFRNQPVGCCSTIIYMMYMERGIEIEPRIAGLLLSAILSDTLMFRSPTCTDVDREVGKKLADIAGVDIEELAVSMFEAGSAFSDRSTEEIFYQDFKVFQADDTRFAVAQISAVSAKQLESIRERILEFASKVIEDKGLDMVFVMMTNIFEQSTELLYEGKNAREILSSAFGDDKLTRDHSASLPGVVSRKKQLIPSIMRAMQE
ncbi:MAG: putative manganese-dependent inorganic diphosphatase [Lachnospiraceae bacterium]|nr:putative manganese-dependent inorganic diphosphatase [Lachnospiraceae bacterium]